MDGQHKNHIEAFDNRNNFRAVLNHDGSIDEAKAKAAEGRKLSSDQRYEALDERAITVYRCPNCRRLHLEEGQNKFTTYVVE